jgi:hypothetical protein
MRIRALTCVIFGALVWVFAGAVASAQVTFTKVADTSTTIPVGQFSGQLFRAFPTISNPGAPAIDQGQVAFVGRPISDLNGPDGVYSWSNGTLGLVVDPSMKIPGTNTNFNGDFGGPLIQGNTSIFTNNDGVGQRVYQNTNGTLSTIIGSTTTYPGSNVTFNNAGAWGYDGQNVTISSDLSNGQSRILLYNNGITTAAVTGQATPSAPVGDVFTQINTAAPGKDGNVAFVASSGTNDQDFSQQGVYESIGGSLSRVADRTMSAPGTGGTFTSFDNIHLAYDGQTVAFIASDTIPNSKGIWKETNGGPLAFVAFSDEIVPGGSFFTDFTGLAVDSGHVAFSALLSNGNSDIWTDFSGTVQRVIGAGDILFGKTVDTVDIGLNGLSGNQIAFEANFTDGSSGIYVATLPEPSSMLFLLGTVAFVAIRRSAPVFQRQEA